MNRVGDGVTAENASWSFGGGTAENFDSHVSRSVPLYKEGHALVCALSDFFIKGDSTVYEIGCSTGTLTLKLARRHAKKPGARFIGIDIEPEMVAQANANKSKARQENVEFLADDALLTELHPSDLVVAYYTVQFVRPSARQDLISKIYETLRWGGALLLFEKVRGPDARFQDILTALYNDYKLEQGYTPEEVVSKSRSLKGVLEPFSTQGNIDLLRRAGFVDVMTVMKYLCFEGFVAIK